MQVLITGGTGFVGGHVIPRLQSSGHSVAAIGTRAESRLSSQRSFQYIQADTTRPGAWQEAVAQADLIFNLAGRTIFRRWSTRYKQVIESSRIETTRRIVDALPDHSQAVLVSASAVGYYGDGGDEVLTEASAGGKDFLARLAGDWEAVAEQAAAKSVRVVTARFGVVLGADGGALAAMLPAFRSGVGGPVGSGRQWLPWIHIDDLVSALLFLAGHGDLQGPFNLCSPHPVSNKDFARALGSVLGRPAVMPAPAFALKLALGEMADVVLASQRVVPAKLLAAGFEFRYPLLEDALAALLKKSPQPS